MIYVIIVTVWRSMHSTWWVFFSIITIDSYHISSVFFNMLFTVQRILYLHISLGWLCNNVLYRANTENFQHKDWLTIFAGLLLFRAFLSLFQLHPCDSIMLTKWQQLKEENDRKINQSLSAAYFKSHFFVVVK